MVKVIDNLRSLKTEEKVDKPYLEKVMKSAMDNLNMSLSTKLEISDEEEWTVKRSHNPIMKDVLVKEKLRISIPIHNKTHENNRYSDSHCTIILNEQKYAYKTYYGLEKEFECFPDVQLSNQDFKEKYSSHKKSLKNIDYVIMNSLGAYYTNYKTEKSFDYKHLDFYLNTIFDNYCEILKESNVNFKICYKNEKFNNSNDPINKKIIIETNDGKPFLGIKISVRRSQRLINFQFMNDYYISVQFDQIDLEIIEKYKNNFGNRNTNSNYPEDDILFHNRNPLRYNNRFHLIMLDNYKTPNYYFFLGTPKGYIKMNKSIMKDGIKNMLHHYIFSLLFKESGMDIEQDDFFENLASYLDMYSLIKY